MSKKDEFLQKVESEIKDNGVSRADAVIRVTRSDPALHKAMVAEANPRVDLGQYEQFN